MTPHQINYYQVKQLKQNLYKTLTTSQLKEILQQWQNESNTSEFKKMTIQLIQDELLNRKDYKI